MNHTLGDPFRPLHSKLKCLALDPSHVCDLTAGLGVKAGLIHNQPDRLARAIEGAVLMPALAIDPAQNLAGVRVGLKLEVVTGRGQFYPGERCQA